VDRLDRATGSWVFSDWQPLLKSDGIPFCTVTFHQSDDPCGSAKDHAKELGDIVVSNYFFIHFDIDWLISIEDKRTLQRQVIELEAGVYYIK
jgi:hypothetical protein